MKLSIIIPIYNCEKYLMDCVESIIKSIDDYEILLINDGSTDNSKQICDYYSKKYNFIKTYNKKNGGVSSARNLGIKMASGKYIMFVDSDDKLEENWSILINKLKNSDIYYFNDQININESKQELLKYIVGNNKKNIFLSGPYSKAYNTDFIRESNILFDEKIINGEDMLFNIKCIQKTNNYKILNFSFYKYRISNDQSTKKFNSKIIDSDKEFQKELSKVLEKIDISKSEKKDIEKFCENHGVLMLLNRISYIDKYKKAKLYYELLENDYYKAILNEKNNTVFYLLRKKQYLFVFYIYKIKNIYRIVKNKHNRNKFKDI